MAKRPPNLTLTDEDNPEWTEETFAQAVSFEEMHPELAEARRRGHPKSDNQSTFVFLWLDSDVVQAFRATGKGWRKRINEVLKQHKPVT